MKKEIVQYYDKLASEYDEDRFSNTYGKYIHQQERKVLEKYLDKNNIENNLDIACGTGRILDFSATGMDISQEMVKVSKEKYPEKNIIQGDAETIPFEENSFKNITSFHLFMHLDLETTKSILTEVHRVLEKDGLFIFDIPSEKRRKLTNYKSENWHGGNQITLKTIEKIITDNWEVKAFHGIAFFPIHRIPISFRSKFVKFDSFLCNSTWKEYSSHLIFVLKKC
ncbi:class I SAM-dependent methyltransferase [Aureivirga sp. CE67]|uniref:class I SAM-dependent methyltransferase n=1 Tax=Aureivirga sp. CE67 TaxID=1788983 RepID=UPI0018C98D15|nr:class I SAM-dependent methyltransferase [Aureivirga sp. CE67]